MESLLAYFLSHWPAFTLIVALIILVGIATWRLAKYHYSLEETKNKVSSLPCESHKIHGDEIKTLKAIVTSTNDVVIEMSRWIAGKDKSMIGTLIKKNSPYVITNIGEEVLEESGGKKIIDDNLEFFIGEMEALNPQTPYNVEEEAFNVVFRNMGNEIYGPIKEYIYYSPGRITKVDTELNTEREVEISMPAILNVMGIYLRDLYFQKHTEIDKLPELT